MDILKIQGSSAFGATGINQDDEMETAIGNVDDKMDISAINQLIEQKYINDESKKTAKKGLNILGNLRRKTKIQNND